MQLLIDFGPLFIIGALLLAERALPGRRYPTMRWWRLRGAVYFVVFAGLNLLVPMLLERWLGEHRLLDARGLGLGWETLLAVVALQLGSYAWHRALHESDRLWRIHQLHHSAERMDVAGAFLFHPLDVIAFALVGSLTTMLVVGVSGGAAGLANLVVFAAVVLGHANIRTPAWLGYFVQRPENHALHHQRGVHRYNYADFSIIDMIFGTFRNADDSTQPVGFWLGASEELGDLLLLRDVSETTEPSPT